MKQFALISILLSSLTALSATYTPLYISNRTEQTQGAGNPNACVLNLANVDSRFAIEWRVLEANPNWMTNIHNAGYRVVASNGTECSGATCFTHGDRDAKKFTNKAKATEYIDDNGQIHSFKAYVPYYFAARHFIDENKNGVWDNGEFVREWTPSLSAAGSGDYIQRCTFNEAQ